MRTQRGYNGVPNNVRKLQFLEQRMEKITKERINISLVKHCSHLHNYKNPRNTQQFGLQQTCDCVTYYSMSAQEILFTLLSSRLGHTYHPAWDLKLIIINLKLRVLCHLAWNQFQI